MKIFELVNFFNALICHYKKILNIFIRYLDGKDGITEYKEKIINLERENETLRKKADFFVNTSKELESKEEILKKDWTSKFGLF